MSDISAATESAKDVEARFQAVVETIVDAIVTIDERGRIDFLNSAAEHMFGYSRAELVGRNVNVLMPEPDSGRHDGYLQAYLSSGVRKIIGIGREVQGKRADGTLFPLELAVSEVRVQNRRLFTGVLRDITERRRIEHQLHAARQAAHAANEAKTTFLRHMGHDLRTPLTPIVGYAELLLEDVLTEDQREAISAIRRNAELMIAQISSLLDAVANYDTPPTSQATDYEHSSSIGSGTNTSANPTHDSGNFQILIADDSTENQQILRQMLTRRGIVSRAVSNGKSAVSEVLLAANSGRPFDLIVMDIQMPDLNGWDATRKLRASGIEIPIIAITALSLPNDMHRCLESGCQEVLRKPIKFNQLVEVLDRWLPEKKASLMPALRT